MKEFELKERDYEKMISMFSTLYSDRIKENIESHNSTFEKEIKILNELKIFFFLLSTALDDDKNSSVKTYGRIYLGQNYSEVIANNFYTIKILFEQGLHKQMQLILRNQFEFVNILLAFMSDDNYYIKYTQEDKNSNKILTPKPINTEKCIKNFISSSYPKQGFNLFWSTFKNLMTIYNELSITAHGNIPYVALQSFEGIKDDENKFNKNICGVKYPLRVTQNLLENSLNYFQIIKHIIFIAIIQKDLLDKKSPVYDYLKVLAKSHSLFTDDS